MAVDFIEKYQRGTVYDFYPEQIQVPASLNGRYKAPKTGRMIRSILRRGQIQPVVIRSDGGTPTLTAGFTRWRAISEINRDKLAPGGVKLIVHCVYRKGNEQDGVAINIEENLFRNDTTEMDDAHNVERLASYGQSHEEIAELYGQSEAWVKSRLTMASLSKEAQIAVTAGRLKPTAAATIAKLSEEQQRALVAGEGKVTGAMIAKASGKTPIPTAAKIIKILRAVIDEGTYPEDFDFAESGDLNDTLVLFCKSVLSTIGVKVDAN